MLVTTPIPMYILSATILSDRVDKKVVPSRGGVLDVEEGEAMLRHGLHDTLSQTPFHSTTILILRHTLTGMEWRHTTSPHDTKLINKCLTISSSLSWNGTGTEHQWNGSAGIGNICSANPASETDKKYN